MNRLFETVKVGAFVDGFGPAIEKRRGGETTILRINFRIQPFDSKLATSLDEGVGGDSNIRSTVFNLNSGEPRKRFTRHDFKLELPRQTLELYASPDTDVCRVALAQAKITGCYVRTEKDSNALAFIFQAKFGPVGRDELELVNSLYRLQTFVTFLESEPLLDEVEDGEDDDDDMTDADEKAQRPALMFNTAEDGAPLEEDTPSAEATRDAKRSKGVNRKLHSHQRGKKKTRGGATTH